MKKVSVQELKKKTKTKAASIAIQQNNTPRLQLMQISAALVILAISTISQLENCCAVHVTIEPLYQQRMVKLS